MRLPWQRPLPPPPPPTSVEEFAAAVNGLPVQPTACSLQRVELAACQFQLVPHLCVRGMHGGISFNPKGCKPGVKYPRSKFPNGIPGVSTDEFPAEWFDGVRVRAVRIL